MSRDGEEITKIVENNFRLAAIGLKILEELHSRGGFDHLIDELDDSIKGEIAYAIADILKREIGGGRP